MVRIDKSHVTTDIAVPKSSEKRRSGLEPETIGIAHVPSNRRYGRPRNQFSVRFAPVIYLAGIYLGASGGPLGLGLIGSITAIVTANILGSLITGLCSAMGPRLGMPQLPMGRAAFGYVGNFLPSMLTLLMCIGYYSAGTVLGARSLADLLHAPYAVVVVAISFISIIIGAFGYRILHSLGSIVTKVSIVVLTVVSLFMIFHGGGPGTDASASGTHYWLAWSVLFASVFGYTASWAPYASDYSRYLPENSKPGAVFRASALGLFTSTTWMMCLGAALIALLPDGDVLDAIDIALPQWLQYVTMLVFGISAIPHNSVNLYSASINALSCNVRLPQWVTVAVAGVFGSVIALFFGGDNFQTNFLLFLHVLSYYIAPWAAILLIDYYILQRAGKKTPPIENFYTPHGMFGRFNAAGLVALIASVAVSVPFMANDFYTGPVGQSLGDADLSYFVSPLIAALLYLVMRRSSPYSAPKFASVSSTPDTTEMVDHMEPKHIR